jgi:hypothetical protein
VSQVQCGLEAWSDCACAAVWLLQELLDMSLSAPGRVTLPRAPPHSLLLYGSQFAPFPTGWGLDTPLVSQYTGDRLSLREGGQQLREGFRKKVRGCYVAASAV